MCFHALFLRRGIGVCSFLLPFPKELFFGQSLVYSTLIRARALAGTCTSHAADAPAAPGGNPPATPPAASGSDPPAAPTVEPPASPSSDPPSPMPGPHGPKVSRLDLRQKYVSRSVL